MKNIYILTAHDSQLNCYIATQHYSNPTAAKGSFDALKEHLIEKYHLQGQEVVDWTFQDGGIHRTQILGKRFNVTLNHWSVSKDVSTFIK